MSHRQSLPNAWSGRALPIQSIFPSSPPYGLRRLLLDKQGTPLYLLAPGQRKATRKQRVTLVLGEAAKVAAVRRVFREFVDLGYSTAHIADGLNANRIASPRGDRWTSRQVLACLRTKSYAAPIIYRRQKKTSRGKADQWVRMTKGGDCLEIAAM